MHAQDYEPIKLQFKLGDLGDITKPYVFLSADSGYFKQNNYILGWAWGMGRKITEALFDNSSNVADTFAYPKRNIAANTNLIINAPGIHDAGSGSGAANSQSIRYSPVLHIINPETQTNIRPSDPRNSIFGFRHIHGEPYGSTDVSLKLDTNGVYKTDTLGVLDSCWSDNALYWYTIKLSDNLNAYDINTAHMYFTINIKRTDLNKIKDTMPVLRIRLPYNLSGIQNNIRLDSIPDTSAIAFDTIKTTLGVKRGLSRRLVVAPANTRDIIIRRNMLPNDSNITISAWFRCDSDYTDFNPYLNGSGHLGIQVFYLGNLNCQINEIYLATPWARKLYYGAFDSTIKNVMQGNLTYYCSHPFADSGCKPFRFFLRDEIGMSYFGMTRYFNKLIGNITTTQSGIPFPSLYFYNTNSPDDWIETQRIDPLYYAPFFKNFGNGVGTLGIYSGYKWSYGQNPATDLNDTLNSGYETHLRNNWSLNYARSISDSLFIANGINASLCYQVTEELSRYWNVFKQNLIPLYANKPWWGESFVGSNIVYATTNCRDSLINDTTTIRVCDTVGVFSDYNRVKTGEEIKLGVWFDIILSCKGLLYDRDEGSFPFYGLGRGQAYYLSKRLDTLNNFSFIYNDSVGSDFFNPKGDYDNILKRWIPLQNTTSAMEVDSNRVYLGRKSPRVELYKIHNWVKANDTTLMNLRLACWYGKGFKTWYNQDTARYGNDSLIKKFIDYPKIITRPPGRIRCYTWGNPINDACVDYYEQDTYEQGVRIDSGFYDITLLRNSLDTTLTSDQFFVGCLNRRSDPLLLFQDTLQPNAWLNFYPTAELDLLARFGGKSKNGQFHDSTWWRSMYDKRLGTREITIPFNYKPKDTTEYCLLRITDLGSGTSLETDSSAWWFREPFKHRVDTVIGQNRSVIVKLLPGEGRILKVEVLHPGIATGLLAHSNQSKLVAFPVDSVSDTVRYHLTYYKLNPATNKNVVYYRRSQPIKKDCPNENILWEPEFSLSKIIYDINNNLRYDPNCDYPSIVVRKDGGILKAYIVYTCDDTTWSHPGGSVIVENQIKFINDSYSSLNIDTLGLTIANYLGKNRSVYGTPSINGSGGSTPGNYYAWSDSNFNFSKIITAWKPANALKFSSPANYDTVQRFNWPMYPSGQLYLSSYLLHPSLNVYSDINRNEDNCSMVFQGTICNGLCYSQIFYTRLKHTTAGLKRYLPTLFNDPNFMVDTNFRLARLTDNLNYTESHSFPTIIRNIGNYMMKPPGGMANRKDRVYWQTHYSIISDDDEYLYSRAIDLTDTFFVSKSWRVYKPTIIRNYFYWLEQPTVNNGMGIAGDGSLLGNELNLNFTASSIYQSPSPQSQIWQFPHELNSLITTTDTFMTNSVVQKMYRGQQPHLSANSQFWGSEAIWKNRRVFESDTASPPRILSSAQYFYKRALADNEVETEGLVGFNNDTTYYYINLPTLNDDYLPLLLPYVPVIDTASDVYYQRMGTDTINSTWFQVNDNATINFKCYGYDTSKVAMKIHQQNTNNYVVLNLPPQTTDSTGIIRSFTLVNGQGFNYRLEFTNRDTTAKYSEKLNLFPLPITDTLFYKTSEMGSNLIDLQGQCFIDNNSGKLKLSINPNPTANNLYATAYLPVSAFVSEGRVSSLITLKIFSTLGTELYKQDVKAGETIIIPVSNLLNGVYFIRAEAKNNYDNAIAPITQSFVIQR